MKLSITTRPINRLWIFLITFFILLGIMGCGHEKHIDSEQGFSRDMAEKSRIDTYFKNNAKFVGEILSNDHEFLYFVDDGIDTVDFSQMLSTYSDYSHIPVKPFKISDRGRFALIFWSQKKSMLNQKIVQRYFGVNAKFARYGGYLKPSIFVPDAYNSYRTHEYVFPALFIRNIHNEKTYFVLGAYIPTKVEFANIMRRVATIDININ